MAQPAAVAHARARSPPRSADPPPIGRRAISAIAGVLLRDACAARTFGDHDDAAITPRRRRPRDDPRHPCGARLLAGKWSVDILYLLASGTRRYSEVLYEVGEISKKTLTQTLRSLEHDGLVARRVLPEVPSASSTR